MTYSDEHLEEIESDPIRLRAYFWNVAMQAKRRAANGTHYLNKESEEQFAQTILDNIDALVESSLRNDPIDSVEFVSSCFQRIVKQKNSVPSK